MRRGPRSTRTTRYSAKRRKGGLKRAATRTSKAPVATGYSRKGGMKTQYSMQQVSDTCVRITGRSYLGAVNNNTSAANGIGLLFDINPTLLGDRVAVLSSTYDKYCYQTMKFTYVPQCPTSQPGSVMLVFERDPEAGCADPTSSSYMQEVMSYEHAVLTPAWVSANVTYKRDPHEVKTWFMSGNNGVASPRDTSQGSFIAYTSNAQIISSGANGQLGFVVMDYVLDLISPNILPNKQLSFLPGQYIAATYTAANQQPYLAAQNASSTNLPTGVYQQQFLCNGNNGISSLLPRASTSGAIVEIVLNSGGYSGFTNLGYASNGSAAPSGSVTIGSRIYAVGIQSVGDTANSGAPLGSTQIWYFAATLQDAIGLVSASSRIGTGSITASANNGYTYATLPGALFYVGATWTGSAYINQNCFLRVLSSAGDTDTA